MAKYYDKKKGVTYTACTAVDSNHPELGTQHAVLVEYDDDEYGSGTVVVFGGRAVPRGRKNVESFWESDYPEGRDLDTLDMVFIDGEPYRGDEYKWHTEYWIAKYFDWRKKHPSGDYKKWIKSLSEGDVEDMERTVEWADYTMEDALVYLEEYLEAHKDDNYISNYFSRFVSGFDAFNRSRDTRTYSPVRQKQNF